MSGATFAMRRRVERPSPLRDLRIGDAARSGRPARIAFPGIAFGEPAGGWRRTLATALALLAHVAVIGALFALAWIATPPEKDEPIPIQLVHVKPPPPPPPPPIAKVEPPPAPKATPAPVIKPAPPPPAPAPAPKALAERRSVNFAPSAQTVSPQIINPSVIARAAPAVDTKSMQSSAPREIQSSAVAIQAVQAVTNVSAPTPTQVDIGNAGAPALRGPVQAAGAAGPSVGPKAIAAPSAGESVGTGKVVVSGDGSSVREGVVSNRDVLGSPDGARVASANTNVGQGNLRGSGEGTTLGGNDDDCLQRAEVNAYLSALRDRTTARWVLPADAPSKPQARLRWQLDVGGSATRVEVISATNPKIGASVVEALRSASPFPPMNDRVRCLADKTNITGIFSTSTSSKSGSVAN